MYESRFTDVQKIIWGSFFFLFRQLVDDLLDFVSSEQQMGKPTAADLKLGLATAPVLFAAQEVRDAMRTR